MMTSGGMYDGAGEFAYRVGMPGKSGVGGGIVAIVPRTSCRSSSGRRSWMLPATRWRELRRWNCCLNVSVVRFLIPVWMGVRKLC